MKRWAELVGALTLLTRLPIGGWTASYPAPADGVWAYPIVGVVVGGIGAGVLAAALALGLPQPLAALWAVVATVVLTGGLHEDGLADTADGFGGGHTIERKLAIMRDSRIGSFGTLALLFSVALRAGALAVLPHPVEAILLAAILGRGAMLLPLALLSPARADGLAATLRSRRLAPLSAGLALTALAGSWRPAAMGAALAAGLAVTRLARRQVGGYTGDVLGATEQAAEAAVLSALAL